MDAKESRLPRKIACQDGTEVEIKILHKNDIPALKDLYRALGAADRALLREDVLNEHYDKRLANQIEDENIYRIVAWQKGEIFASLTMVRGFARWRRHTCELRSVVHPHHRRLGIASNLLEEAIFHADSLGIEKLYINLQPEQIEAIKMAETLGFRMEASLKHHVKDSFGTYHDIHFYSMDLEAAQKAMGELMHKIDGFSE
ncbi:MAG: GNAT family N-acetyltransferase [Candidatus Electryoneaceae bacterium]|nr:GNAT family N-acetyltransferase [Candidatus Electryoneaceae bacterium]